MRMPLMLVPAQSPPPEPPLDVPEEPALPDVPPVCEPALPPFAPPFPDAALPAVPPFTPPVPVVALPAVPPFGVVPPAPDAVEPPPPLSDEPPDLPPSVPQPRATPSVPTKASARAFVTTSDRTGSVRSCHARPPHEVYPAANALPGSEPQCTRSVRTPQRGKRSLLAEPAERGCAHESQPQGSVGPV